MNNSNLKQQLKTKHTSPTTTRRAESTRPGTVTVKKKVSASLFVFPTAPYGPSCDANSAQRRGCALHVLHHSQCACAFVYPKPIGTLLLKGKRKPAKQRKAHTTHQHKQRAIVGGQFETEGRLKLH